MDIKFKIDEFEGPLDLLLHLIKESKMDIFDIQIEVITKQYFDYIEQQEKMNLEVASEYLVMASELIEMKSKYLLPREISNAEDEVENYDPREELMMRLLEYQAYKEITKTLKEQESLRKEIYTKAPEAIKNFMDEEVIVQTDVTLDDLMSAFQKFLIRKEESKPLSTKVTMQGITVSSRRYEIKKILKSRKKVSFFELFPILNKEYIVATFLAILEMAKNKELVIVQNDTFDDILCEVTYDK